MLEPNIDNVCVFFMTKIIFCFAVFLNIIRASVSEKTCFDGKQFFGKEHVHRKLIARCIPILLNQT